MDPKIAKLYEDAQELLRKARTRLESGDLTAEQQTEVDGWLTQAEALETRAKKLEAVLDADARLNGKEKTADVKVSKDAADQEFADEREFIKAVKVAGMYPGQEDMRLKGLKASGLSEGVPADGGYLIPPQFAAGMLERMYNTGQILSRVASDPVTGNSMAYNGVDETSRVAGSRWGGIRGYWLAEGGSMTKSKPTFRQVELKLKKEGVLAYATDEQLEDTPNLASWLQRTVPEELRFLAEDAIFEGDGVGKPLGIMASNCLVSVTRVDGSKVQIADVVAMWARRYVGGQGYVWYINQDVSPQLLQLSTTYQLAYMPPGGLSAAPYGSLFGRPVIEVEYASTLGTTGDIVLADMSQYQTITKGGVRAESSIHVQFLTDEMTYRFIYRMDGAPIWSSALTPFKGTNTVSPFVCLTTST